MKMSFTVVVVSVYPNPGYVTKKKTVRMVEMNKHVVSDFLFIFDIRWVYQYMQTETLYDGVKLMLGSNFVHYITSVYSLDSSLYSE